MMRKKNIISIQGESSGGRPGEFSNVVNVKDKEKGTKYGTFEVRQRRHGMGWKGSQGQQHAGCVL